VIRRYARLAWRKSQQTYLRRSHVAAIKSDQSIDDFDKIL